MRSYLRNLLAATAALTAAMPAPAEQRFLLAAENQLTDINRASHVTSVLKLPGHRNIWEVWRLPDGGIPDVHRDRMALFEMDNRLVMVHAAARNGNDVEAPGGAMLDSVAAEIPVVDRKIALDPHLTKPPPAPHLAFTTGLQHLHNGNLQLACGDHHMKTAAEGRHQLAELRPNGTIASKITRTQLIDPIEGFVDPKTGIEELRITNLRADDAAKLNSALAVNR